MTAPLKRNSLKHPCHQIVRVAGRRGGGSRLGARGVWILLLKPQEIFLIDMSMLLLLLYMACDLGARGAWKAGGRLEETGGKTDKGWRHGCWEGGRLRD